MFRIGEFARITGVSLRTLHHYEEVGLLRPHRSEGSNYRLYTAADLERMRRILTLRGLGFPLERIRLVLQGLSGDAYLEMLRAHLVSLETEIQTLQSRHAQLKAMLEEAPMYTPEIRSIPAQRVISARGIARDYKNVTAPMQALAGKLWSHLQSSKARCVGSEIVIWEGNYGDMDAFTLEWMIPIEGNVTSTDEIKVYTLPPIPQMGVVRHVGSYEHLDDAYAALAAWLEEHGYERDGNLREVYVHYDEDHNKNVTEVQVPVRVKQG